MPPLARRRGFRSNDFRSANDFFRRSPPLSISKSKARKAVALASLTRLRSASKFATPIATNADHLSVEDGRTFDPSSVVHDQRVALRPIGVVDRVEPNASITHMDLNPIAIVLQPCAQSGRDSRLTRMNETGRRV